MAEHETDLAGLELRIIASWALIPSFGDPHEKRALEEFGVVNEDTKRRAKIINYQELYGAGQIFLAKTAGRYPLGGTVG